ncbi:MAG: MFS transporter [Desulfobacterales bacterium]|nr:MFS transporter [Desulfobacterales bacterium]
METFECPTPEPLSDSIAITLLLAWLFYLTFVSRMIFAPLMPIIQEELNWSHARVGSLFLLQSIGATVAPVFVGWLTASIQHRGTLFVSNLMVGLSLILFTLLEKSTGSGIAMVLVGLSAGLHIPSAVATITAQVRKKDWGKAMGIHQIAPPANFISAPLIATLFLVYLTWQQIVFVMGLLNCMSAAVFLIFFKNSGRFPGKALHLSIVKEVVARKSFWLMVGLFSMAMAGTQGIYAMLPLYLVTEKSMDGVMANTLIGLSQIGGLIMVFFAGWVTDRVGIKKTLGTTLLLAGIFTILIGKLHGFWLIVSVSLQPVFVASFFPGAFAAVAQIAPPRLRSVNTALAPGFALLIGAGLVPAGIGYFAEWTSFSLGIVCTGLFILFGPLLANGLILGQYDDEDGC